MLFTFLAEQSDLPETFFVCLGVHSMKSRLLIVTAVVVLAGCCSGVAIADQPPGVGDFVPSYASTKCGGIVDKVPVGKTVCYTCRAGDEPIFYVFSKKRVDSVAGLVRRIDALVAMKKEKNAAAVINFLGNPEDEKTRRDVADFGVQHGLQNVSLTLTKEGSKFGAGDGDEVIVILFEKGIIRMCSAIRPELLDEKATEAIIRDSRALLN